MTALTMSQIKLAFQVSPIWLTGRPVAGSLGGMLPIIAITNQDLYSRAFSTTPAPSSAAIVGGGGSLTPTIGLAGSTVVASVENIDLDDAFGAFTVIPGGTLIDQAIATYPYANQQIAGNATIFNPLKVSLIWDTPLRGPNPPVAGNSAWAAKYTTMINLQAQLWSHNNNGGTFTVVTPSFIYQNVLLTALTDASRGTQPVPQNAWRFDFEKPMIAAYDILAAQGALMSKISGGLATNGQWSGTLAGAGLAATMPQFLSISPVVIPPGVNVGVGELIRHERALAVSAIVGLRA